MAYIYDTSKVGGVAKAALNGLGPSTQDYRPVVPRTESLVQRHADQMQLVQHQNKALHGQITALSGEVSKMSIILRLLLAGVAIAGLVWLLKDDEDKNKPKPMILEELN